MECARTMAARKPRAGHRSCREAIAIARSADHPYSLAVALGYTATTHQLVQDRASAGEAANELISLCERYSFSYYREWGVVVDGWVRGGEAGVVPSSRALTNFGRPASTLGCRTGCMCWLT
jgi:hypothetical protein